MVNSPDNSQLYAYVTFKDEEPVLEVLSRRHFFKDRNVR
jgi:hypothetical protein